MATFRETSDAKTRSARIEARLSSDAKVVIQRAADISGRSISDFVVSSALEAARETIREHEVIVLSARDSITFVEALLDPKGPNEALLAAARRHREVFGPAE
jgi:uncharacterized protein (DUF1778 family)